MTTAPETSRRQKREAAASSNGKAARSRNGNGTKRTNRAKSEARLGWLIAGPAFFIMLAVTAYPIAQAIYDSLFSFRLTSPDDRSFVFLQNYLTILSDTEVFWSALGVTVLVTVVTVAVELVLGFGLALVMHKALLRIRGALRTAILVPYGIITVVSAFAWYYMFDINSGFVNNWFGWVPGIDSDLDWFANFGTAITVIMASEIWKTTPFIALLLLAGLAQVPDELVEAAKVDGASWRQQMTRVILPNMKAAIMVAVLFRALDAFRIFDNVFIMTNGAAGTEVLSLLAYRTSIGRLEIGLGSAVSVILFICVLLICFIAIKFFKVDLASGTDAKGGK
ncbi:carbohydrate ABC transporter permease [Nesterenkonia sp. CF4.4]|uniref:carbohydrate ABC transporter permease n=1 Tax=Nesterenkonia sp. CF4.4 TaxID=3373079 RepID=UPI003EE77E1C